MTSIRSSFAKAFAMAAATTALAIGALGVTPAAAQTIASIKSRGTLIVGVQVDFPPWGFTDTTMKVVGYDIDVANLMAADMGVKVNLVPVTAANRIPYLTTSRVDVLAAAIGMYPERAKAVQFSKPYATLDSVIWGKKSDTVRDWNDLAKSKVGASRGGAGDVAITKSLPPTAQIMRFEDDAVPVQALLSGQIDALASTNLIAPVLARAPNGSQFEQKIQVSRQYNGLASRLGEKEMNAWLNAFVERNIANGKLAEISRKWTGTDLPQMPAQLADVPFTVQ